MSTRFDGSLAATVGRLVAEARRELGFTQRELSRRATVSQSAISRLERGLRSGLDLGDVERLGAAMGGRFRMELRAPFLADRARQRDRVHARCIGYAARQLHRRGWQVASEVEIGGSAGPGWIDLLAWHSGSRVLLVIEVKTEIADFGGVQRTLAWYERRAGDAARRRGWMPVRAIGVLLLLDSRAVADRLRDNRGIAAMSFPGRASVLSGFIDDPRSAVPPPRSLAMIDPLSRRSAWLRPASIDGRRAAPAFLDYADAARRMSG